MSTQTLSRVETSSETAQRSNGAGAAAILAAGVGCLMVALLAILGDKSAFLHSFFIFSKPAGPLSGVSTCAIAIWLACWGVLHASWRRRTLVLARVSVVAILLLVLGMLLTFPPIADLL
jgi:hypothetical protein